MKVIEKKVENSQALLTIEMTPAEVEASLERSYHRLVKKADIPGFRKGRAPRAVLEHHIGKDKLLDDALNDLLPQACEDALKEQEIQAFARPTVEVTKTEPLVFKATVPLPPSIELGDYHSIKDKPKPVRLKETDVNAIIDQLRHQRATWEPVERPVQLNDLVVIDVEGSADGKTFINQHGAQYPVRQDANYPAPGFAQKLLGMKRDEERQFSLKFPDGYGRSELSEKEASFRVKVFEVKEEKLPELDDEFAKGVNPEFETLEALRQQVSANLKQRAQDKARQDFEDRVIEAATKMSRVEYPPVLVDMEVDRMVGQQVQRWQIAARSPEEFRERLIQTPVEKLREEYRPSATERVTQSLVLGQIAVEEKIEVSDQEVDNHILRLTEGDAEDKEEQQKKLDTPENREHIRQLLLTRKIIERLAEIARGSAKKIKKKQKEAK